MPCSADRELDEASDLAASLSGSVVSAVEALSGGRNSRVYKVTAGGSRYALKRYAPPVPGRDRQAVETAALAFIRRHGCACVPLCVAADAARNASLLVWVEGSPPLPPDPADLDAALDFAVGLRRCAGAPDAGALPEAAEACLSAETLRLQVERRWQRLMDGTDGAIDRETERSFTPLLDGAVAHARRLLAGQPLAWDAPLPLGLRTLSPSDFGFHNALRGPDGRLTFLDFEYFGWDDPVKLTADFLLHPGMALDAAMRARFRTGAVACFSRDEPGFALRLEALLPLYALRWTMIVLGDYLPERWEHRVRAGESGPREVVLARQLSKALRLMTVAGSAING